MLEYPGYQRFFLRCSAEGMSNEAAEHFEDLKPETAHEKPLTPRVVLEKKKKLLNIHKLKELRHE